MSLEDRLARLEALVEGLVPKRETPPAPRASEEPEAGDNVSHVLARHRRDGRRMVVTGVGSWHAGSARTATSATIWDAGDRVTLDQRRAAALCQALANEARLAILSELLAEARATADLVASTGLERGQLYHHLRDLFLQGLVEQPERGRYQLTGRGEVVLLLTAALTVAAPDEEVQAIPEELAQPGNA